MNNIIIKAPPVRQMIIPAGRANRPGRFPGGRYEYVTIHETDNTAPTATAAAHGKHLFSATDASWHYTVDDTEIIQHLPDEEHGWHAGDGRNGIGNTQSLGIEICVNAGGNLYLAYLNAAWLAAQKLAQNGLWLSRLKTHNWWSGKDCPRRLRANKAGPMGWEWFAGMVWLQMSAPDPAVLQEKLYRIREIAETA